MNNQDIANVLSNIADILDILKVPFKPRAFRRAAQTVRSLTKDLNEIEDPTTLPTIGKGIAEIIKELLETGTSGELQSLQKKLPPKLLDLFDIPGLGPKSIARFYNELNVKSIKDLEQAVKNHKVAQLNGFGHKTESDILEGIALVRAGRNRMLLGIAKPMAESIKQQLEKVKGVTKVEIVGSIARMKETIGDIDILCLAKSSKEVMNKFTKLKGVTKIIAKGTTKSSILLDKRIQIDLRVLPPHQFGAAKLYFTGSKQHNVKLRQIAINYNFKLNEYGLFNRKTNKLIESKSEAKIYKKLSLPHIPPEMREDLGELNLLKLPKLITLKDIKGDFHMHTTYTDGVNTVKEMAFAAQVQKYQYAAITDHTKSTSIANGNTEAEIAKEIKEIEKVDKIVPLKLFAGSEVDILANGSLDFSNKTLAKLDVVIASIHSGFKKDNTDRILKAINNRYTTAIGHLTGRLINQRNPYSLNVDKVLQAAKDNNVAIELNAQPSRLDANAEIVKQTIDFGCRLMINSDAHSTEGLNVMKYGVGIARKAWATKKYIINTWALKKVENFLQL